MAHTPAPHPAALRHTLRALAPLLDFTWTTGARHGGEVPGTAHVLTHLVAQDHGHGFARELLTDGAHLFAVRFDGVGFVREPGAQSPQELAQRLVARHMDTLAQARPRDARAMIEMLTCADPGGVARVLSQGLKRPVAVSSSIVPILWATLHPNA